MYVGNKQNKMRNKKRVQIEDGILKLIRTKKQKLGLIYLDKNTYIKHTIQK